MIGSSENRISYDGNGIATEFAYQFKILNKSDLYVLHVAADGTEKILTKDYYVDMEKSVVHYPGYAPGAEIPEAERPPVLPVGDRLVLYREVPITQESALDKHWPFNVIEDMADKLTIICQQLADGNDRSLKVSVSQSVENVNLTLPWGKDKTFAWNEEGTGFVLTENPANIIPIVDQKVADMELLIAKKTQEFQDLFDQLSATSKDELLEIRNEVEHYANLAENAALINCRWPYGAITDRDPKKPTYGLDAASLVLNVPQIIKIKVTGESNPDGKDD